MKKQIGCIALVHLLATTVAADTAIAAAKSSASYCEPRSGVDMVDVASIIDDTFARKMNDVGVSVVARYYDYADETLPGKRLRPEELPVLRAHGLKLLVIFQHNNNKPDTFRDWKNRGPQDAAEALKLARGFSQPNGSAIYFGVDGDFVGSGSGYLTDEVQSYFREIQTQFSKTGAKYAVGMYGSGAACDLLRSASLVKYCWMSQSHGFNGMTNSLAAGRYEIEQYLPGTCGGKAVDFDSFRPGVKDIGQFSVP